MIPQILSILSNKESLTNFLKNTASKIASIKALKRLKSKIAKLKVR